MYVGGKSHDLAYLPLAVFDEPRATDEVKATLERFGWTPRELMYVDESDQIHRYFTVRQRRKGKDWQEMSPTRWYTTGKSK